MAEIFVESFDRITGESSDPWLRPCGPQQNFGGTVYSGSNRLVLGLLSSLRGYDLPVWVTFGQAHSKGFHVRKGERSAPVVFYDRWIREKATGRRTDLTEEQWRLLPSAERDLYERACVLKWHSVFNICQTDFAERFPQEHSALVGAVGGGVRSVAELVSSISSLLLSPENVLAASEEYFRHQSRERSRGVRI